jgi:galactokinase
MWGNTIAIHSVLREKTTKLNSQLAQYKKNKIDKDNSGKKKQKKSWKNEKKTMWGNTVTIHSILKKKNYKTKFSTSSILKKKSPKTIL